MARPIASICCPCEMTSGRSLQLAVPKTQVLTEALIQLLRSPDILLYL